MATITYRGEQTTTGKRHCEQRDREGRATEQERTEHGGTNHERRVDSRLETDRKAREDNGRRTGQRGLADVLDRAVLGAGVVAGERQDARGHDDADDNRGGGDQTRVAVRSRDGVGDVAEVGEAARQHQVRRDDRRDCAHCSGDVEGSVDRGQAVLTRTRLGDEDTEHGGQGTDRGNDQREDEAVVTEGLDAEDQRGDQRDGVRLEEVGGHAGAVTNVVADVVGDRRGVARVVLGDVVLDLADEVSTDVGGLGEDAAADSHEHGEQRSTEAEALEHMRGFVLEDQDHEARAEQTQTHGRHTDEGAGAEADGHGRVAALGLGGRGDAQVGLHGQRHAEVTDRCGEARTHQEEQRASDAHRHVIGRQRQQDHERHRGKDAQRPELTGEVGVGPLLHRMRDVLHVVGAFTGSEHLATEHRSETERRKGDHGNDDDEDQIAAREVYWRGGKTGHDSP